MRGTITQRLAVSADDLFDLISNVERLPEWNEHIHHVVDAPGGSLQAGDVWVVEMRVLGRRWHSRSRVQEIDRETRRLTVLSQTDDGNLSYARWRWEVDPADAEAELTVNWELNPRSFWRRILLSKIRQRQLKTEVRDSLRSAGQATAKAAPGRVLE